MCCIVMRRLLLLVMVVGIFGWYVIGEDVSLSQEKMQETHIFLSASLWTNRNSTVLSDKESLLFNYCNGIFKDKKGFIYSLDKSHFEAEESLFLQALCSSLKSENLSTDSLQENFRTKLKLQQYKDADNVCARGKNQMEDCDIHRYVTKIYTAVMGEIFKIKWAHVVQIYTSKTISEEATKRIAKVFSGYFNMPPSEDYKKKFPTTSAMIDRDQKFFAKTLKTLFIVDNDKLQYDVKLCSGNISSLACGLHSSDNGLGIAFTNLIYNEYLQYRLFVDYYTHQINWKVKQMLSEKGKDLNSLSEKDTKELMLLGELELLQQEINIAKETLEMALDDLQDFVATYPLHIGFLMYQEELKKFRDKFAVKMVTPFYTLYEKFKNVQPTK